MLGHTDSEKSRPSGIFRMREKSAAFDSSNELDAFLYILMRDHVTSGVVETIMESLGDSGKTYQFTNGWLARHAVDVADRLRAGSV